MEPGTGDSPKLPDMVMCGDHPSFVKSELVSKDDKPAPLDKDNRKIPSYHRISPTVSRIENVPDRSNAISEHALRLVEARRRARSIEAIPRNEDAVVPGNRAVVQAALGSFRWPPYLVAVWVLVLLVTHALHCVVALLESALPRVRMCCQYFRSWAEDAWRGDTERSSRPHQLALAAAAGLLYALYYALYVLHSVAVWAIEPLLTDEDKRDVETKVTNYLDEVNSKMSGSKSLRKDAT